MVPVIVGDGDERLGSKAVGISPTRFSWCPGVAELDFEDALAHSHYRIIRTGRCRSSP